MADSDSEDSVRIEWSFDAPVELIWQMWTDPDHFKEWYGPDGATVTVGEMDLRPGGKRLVGMEIETPNGAMRMWFIGEFLEVAENTRIIYTESVADEHGVVVPPSEMGMPEGHPSTTEVRVELTAVDDRTNMVMTHFGVPSGSPGAAGWTMAFEKLTARIASHTGK